MFTRSRQETQRRRDPESGHLLLIVMMGLTVAAILLTAVVQQWSIIERRDREEELIFRGNQYVKAIRLYQKEHGGALPTSLRQLYDPGPRRLRYIRKLFRDPLAPDGRWGILLADPSGRGFINPNAAPPDESVEGLEDLGKGFRFDSSLDSKANSHRARKTSGRRTSSDWKGGGAVTSDDDPVTAPGQPQGPIVGVISLYEQESFRSYHNKDDYTEWAFHIFDLPDSEKQQAPPANRPNPTGFGVGPGGSQTIYGGGQCKGPGCPKN